MALGAAMMAAATAAPAPAQPGTLFPDPVRIEHQLSQDDGDGNVFTADSVIDTYGGSWIVSQRPDGSRLVIDLVRRELTEVRTERGTYWTTSFDRFAELQRRLRVAQGLAGADGGAEETRRAAAPRWEAASARPAGEGAATAIADLVVTELPGVARTAPAVAGSRTAASLAGGDLRHLRVAARDSDAAAVDVWVDPSLRLGANAVAALAALDDALAAAPAGAATAVTRPGRFVAAARAHAGGAFVLRTSRPAAIDAQRQPRGRIEDVATRVERLERFPVELVEVPEGLQRVPHPLEATVRFLEEEAERNAAMSGRAQSNGDD